MRYECYSKSRQIITSVDDELIYACVSTVSCHSAHKSHLEHRLFAVRRIFSVHQSLLCRLVFTHSFPAIKYQSNTFPLGWTNFRSLNDFWLSSINFYCGQPQGVSAYACCSVRNPQTPSMFEKWTVSLYSVHRSVYFSLKFRNVINGPDEDFMLRVGSAIVHRITSVKSRELNFYSNYLQVNPSCFTFYLKKYYSACIF